jgi:class 3 adenylate cyclase
MAAAAGVCSRRGYTGAYRGGGERPNPIRGHLRDSGRLDLLARVAAGFGVDLVKPNRPSARDMPPVRRLTAILAADVVGYSRLMGADEEGTHERLKAHLRELIDPKIGEHRGRVVKNTGDGFLAEFASVVDAVRCAAEIQRAMADRNAETPEDKRITFRVGINLGDVIVEASIMKLMRGWLAFGCSGTSDRSRS